MITTASSPSYRPPQGRPRAVPPCDTRGPAIKVETDPRPVREPGESSGHYGARVGHWMDRQDPARKAARVAKRVATTRKNFIQKKRAEAATVVQETAVERWYTYEELAQITGYSVVSVGQQARALKWPIKRLPRIGQAGQGRCAVFGNPATLPNRTRPVVAAAPVLILAPPVAEQIAPPRPSLWQRIKRWFA